VATHTLPLPFTSLGRRVYSGLMCVIARWRQATLPSYCKQRHTSRPLFYLPAYCYRVPTCMLLDLQRNKPNRNISARISAFTRHSPAACPLSAQPHASHRQTFSRGSTRSAHFRAFPPPSRALRVMLPAPLNRVGGAATRFEAGAKAGSTLDGIADATLHTASGLRAARKATHVYSGCNSFSRCSVLFLWRRARGIFLQVTRRY